MKKHYETHVEDTDKLISVAGPILEYKSWYEQYRKLMEEQAQRKYGLYTPTSEGDDDDFPSIPGMIARYSALGLTNEQMAANPVWVDKTGNGHDLQMKNFLWGGMSGIGGYNQNFNQWGYGNLSTATQTHTSYKIELSVPSTLKTTNIYSNANSIGKEGDVYDFTLNIVGLKDGALLRITKGVVSGVIERIEKDGIYKIYQPIEAGWDQPRIYIFISNPNSIDLNITIEQLPLYPGALVFDGVDDYGTCDNFPILTKEKGYTVVALRQWITRGEIAQGLVSNVKNWLKDGAFLLEYRNIQAEHLNKPISFGAIGSENDLPHILTYQTSKSYNGVSITTGNFEGTDVLHVGKLAPTNVGTCINAAIWELVFLDHDATEEELTNIKDYFVKTYPWLFPDQAWTVVGKTNEDEDRATIANITGNGNDLILSNFGFAEGSGYGLYAENYAGGRWVQSTDRADLTWTSYSVNITSVKVASTQLYYQSYPEQPSFTVPSYKIKVYGLKDGQTLSYKQVTSEGQQIYKISEDGTYTLPSFPFKANGDWYGFTLNKVQESCDITIEQIPEYEGYLITDGVDDTGRAVGLTISKDFTLVGEWILFSKTSVNAGLSIHPQIHIFNRPEAIQIMFRTAGKTLPVKSLKAICSDGRCYDENWSELKINVGEFTGNKGTLFVASNGTNYAQIAFKNLGIYDNQILSKDDCIKAYNYLQTLKAK